jgi:shikimate 5-dehydrogenase
MMHSANPVSVRAAADMEFQTAERPTIYVVGTPEDDSLITSLFPRWAQLLQLCETQVRKLDCDLYAQPAVYQNFLRFLKADPLSLGALLTSSKPNLLQNCKELFSSLDPSVVLGGHVSSVSKSAGRLIGHARESVASFSALENFLPADHWVKTGAQILVMGAGCSATAFTAAVMDARHERNRPSRVFVTDREKSQLQLIHKIHKKASLNVPIEYHCITDAGDHDALLNSLIPGSLVINATGMGKYAPGSPITEKAAFPEGGYAWDFDFQGPLTFLKQATHRQHARHLHVEDGCAFYVHRWACFIADALTVEIPSSGPIFSKLLQIARDALIK